MAIKADTVISHYRILSRLGAGGMGEVYKARDTTLDRTVALKILPADLVENEDRVRRFVQEAKSASALNHPHIVTIYEIGQATLDSDQVSTSDSEAENANPASPMDSKPIHFIAMEYVDGDTLRAKTHRDKTDVKRLLEVLAQVAEGLAKAHTSGIVHRDLKPENIMVTQDGYAKILDFGLAKLMEPKQPSSGDAQEAATLLMEGTQPGMVVGTVGYMSPEQVQGRTIDQRSDIFSFGCILYEVATGRRPFAGESVIDSLHKIVYAQAPPIREFSPDTPAELQRVVRKCLSKDPEERYQSIKDVALDLRELIKEYDTLPPASGPHPVIQGATSGIAQGQRSPVRWIALAAASLVAIAALAFGVYKFVGTNKTRTAAPFNRMEISRLTNTGKASNVAISPDGKYVVHVKSEAGLQSIWVRQVATTSNVEIVPPEEVSYAGLAFSPDGNYIYYLRTVRGTPLGELYQVPVLGRTPKKLISDIDSPVSFSPDGKQLAFVRGNPSGEMALMIANADGTGERKLATRKLPEAFAIPAWSPDGKVIACSAAGSDAGGQYMNVVEVRVENGAQRPITDQRWLQAGHLAWLSDGKGLVISALDQTSRLFQIWRISYPDGGAHRITNDLNNYVSLSITADSNTLATVQSDSLSNIWIVPSKDPNNSRQITSGFGKYNSVAWTPDGKIVYGSNASGNLDLWIMEPDGTGQKQLTADAGQNALPLVTPDGRQILFVSNRGNSTNAFNIWRMDIDGGNPKQITSGGGELWPQRSPDGRWIVYADVSAGKPSLWKVPIEGGAPVQLTDKFSLLPAISPDGKLIAFYYWDEQLSSQLGAAIMPFEGGQVEKIPNIPAGQVRWTADGRALTYVKNSGGVSNIWSQPIDGSAPKQLTDFKNDLIFEFDWSHDGKHLACFRGFVTRDVVLIKNLQ